MTVPTPPPDPLAQIAAWRSALEKIETATNDPAVNELWDVIIAAHQASADALTTPDPLPALRAVVEAADEILDAARYWGENHSCTARLGTTRSDKSAQGDMNLISKREKLRDALRALTPQAPR